MLPRRTSLRTSTSTWTPRRQRRRLSPSSHSSGSSRRRRTMRSPSGCEGNPSGKEWCDAACDRISFSADSRRK
ncbi:hypothetical protein MHYP_G00234200 [Metynnis hypsauchen]